MEWYIVKGIIRESKQKSKHMIGLEDFSLIFKKNLTKFKVPYRDLECVETDNVSTVRYNNYTDKLEILADPVEHVFIPFTPIADNTMRYNPITGKLDYYDPVTKTWKTADKFKDGMSAYEIAVANGFVGTEAEWLESLEGAQGPSGATGPAGPGVASGGATNQVLLKNTAANFDTKWSSLKTINSVSIIGSGNIAIGLQTILDIGNTASNQQIQLNYTADSSTNLLSSLGLTLTDTAGNKKVAVVSGTKLSQLSAGQLLIGKDATKNSIITSNDTQVNTHTLPNKSGTIAHLSDIVAQTNSDWDATSGPAQILNKPNLAPVATSGNYNDLTNKPTIPSGQIPSDWNQTNVNAVDYIKNKPTLGTVASHDVGEFATAAQGAKADTALQVETQTVIGQPYLTGNILSIVYTGENGVVQTKNIDLSPLVLVDIHIEGATYDAAQNKITLTLSDGTEYTIDLSEFSIISTTDVNGITTLQQEGITKATISKVGSSGQYADLLGKPVTKSVGLIGDSTSINISYAHNLDTEDIVCNLWDNNTGKKVDADIELNGSDEILIKFTNPPGVNQIKVVVIK